MKKKNKEFLCHLSEESMEKLEEMFPLMTTESGIYENIF